MEIQANYELGDKVLIKPFEDVEGIIHGIYYCSEGVKYYVYYWKDYNREFDYFYPYELELVIE